MSTALDEAAAALLARAGAGPHSRLCCALSGGVDSVVLVDVLARLRERFGYALEAAHVHHGLSPQADAWCDFCAEYCRRLEIPFSALHVVVPRDDPEGLEAAARRVRHAALERIDCDWLVFGHHRDDQAETLLFRLFRGAGVRGAGAMAAIEVAMPGRAGRLRPFLGHGRSELHAWAQDHALRWVEDESNADHRFARNDIRHRILPAIEHAFPAAATTLARAAGHFREASDLLDELAASDAAACRCDERDDGLRRDALLALSDARIVNLLRWQVRRHGSLAPGRARLREALRQLRGAACAHPLRLELGALAWCAYRERVWLEPARQAHPEALHWRDGVAPGQVLAWGAGGVEFRARNGGGIAQALLGAGADCRLVTRTAGLRLRPGRGRPSRTLKNLCQEAGMPAWMRAQLPVLEIDGRLAWVGGIGVDAAFACPPGEPGILPVWVPLRT